jgi:hypothetical protein
MRPEWGPKSLPDRRDDIDTEPMQYKTADAELCERRELDTCGCMRLLASEQVGHLGLTAKALPVVTPIRYRLVGQSILFATASRTELNSARNRAVACIEIAGVDSSTGMEWTVLATGRLREVGDPPIASPGDAPMPPAWGAPNAQHFAALDIELLNGCAFEAH